MSAKKAIDRRILATARPVVKSLIEMRGEQLQQAKPVQGNVASSYTTGRSTTVTMQDGSTVTGYVGSRPIRAGDTVTVFGSRIFT